MDLIGKYTLAVLFTATIVGGATYAIVSHQAKSDNAALQTTIDSLNAEITKLKVATPPINQLTDFLALKGLGIKLPLTADIKDLIYTYSATSTPAALHFSTTSIKNISNKPNTCGADQDPLGTYTVYTSRQTDEGAGDNQAGTLETTVNGYYIYYHHVQYACGDTPQDQAKVAALISPLLSAVQGAEAVQN